MLNQKWDERYVTGIVRIDEDHKGLITLINEAHRLFVYGNDSTDYADLLDSLCAYTVSHFAYEETWMTENGYPNMGEHLLEHQSFSKKVSELVDGLKSGTGRLSLDLLSFLRVWLLTHIAVHDADLGAFSRQRSGQTKVVGL